MNEATTVSATTQPVPPGAISLADMEIAIPEEQLLSLRAFYKVLLTGPAGEYLILKDRYITSHYTFLPCRPINPEIDPLFQFEGGMGFFGVVHRSESAVQAFTTGERKVGGEKHLSTSRLLLIDFDSDSYAPELDDAGAPIIDEKTGKAKQTKLPMTEELKSSILNKLENITYLNQYLVVVHSGGGMHVYYLLPEGVTPEVFAKYAMALLDMATPIYTEFAGKVARDESSAVTAQFYRLPGTLNEKYDRRAYIAATRWKEVSPEFVQELDALSKKAAVEEVKHVGTAPKGHLARILSAAGFEVEEMVGDQEICCPFPTHPENTPSFKFDTSKNVWHCFGAKHVGPRSGGADSLLSELLLAYTERGLVDRPEYINLRKLKDGNLSFRLEECNLSSPGCAAIARGYFRLMDKHNVSVYRDFFSGDYIMLSGEEIAVHKTSVAKDVLSGELGEEIKFQKLIPALPKGKVVFNPKTTELVTHTGFNTYEINRFRGFKYGNSGAVVKEIPPFLDKLFQNVIPEDDIRKHFHYGRAWFFQKRRRSEVGWVFMGPFGTGKGLLFEIVFKELLGTYHSLVTAEELESGFNGYLDECLMLVYDESERPGYGKTDTSNKLKRIVTGKEARLNPKYGKQRTVPMQFDFFVTSNDMIPVVVEDRDRRYIIVKTGPALKGQEWFDKEDHMKCIYSELEALACYYLSYDLSCGGTLTEAQQEKLAMTALDTEAKDELIDDSMPIIQKFFKMVREGRAAEFIQTNIGNNAESLEKQLDGHCRRGFIPVAYIKQLLLSLGFRNNIAKKLPERYGFIHKQRRELGGSHKQEYGYDFAFTNPYLEIKSPVIAGDTKIPF